MELDGHLYDVADGITAATNSRKPSDPNRLALLERRFNVKYKTGEFAPEKHVSPGAFLHTTLDLFGLLPGIGEGADLLNAGWYALQGDWENAGLSAASAIPFAGWGSTAAKWGAKGARVTTALGYASRVSNRTKVLGEYKGKSDSYILRQELKDAGIEPPPYPNAAHHIVPVKDKRAKAARDILSEYGIDLNAAVNGVFLPRVKEHKWVGDESRHIGGHSLDYINYVTNRLRRVRSYGGSQADIVDVLNDIRSELLSGSLKLNNK